MIDGIFKSIELAVRAVAQRCLDLAREAARIVIPGSGRRFILRMVAIARGPDRRVRIISEIQYLSKRVGPRALGIRVRSRTSRIGRAILGHSLDWLTGAVLRLAVRWAPKLSARRLARGECRTLWGVTPILTLPLKARADRLLGFESKSIVYVTYVITSQFDINLRKYYIVAAGLGILPSFQRLVLAWHLLRCDVFSFFADRGLFFAKLENESTSMPMVPTFEHVRRRLRWAVGISVPIVWIRRITAHAMTMRVNGTFPSWQQAQPRWFRSVICLPTCLRPFI